MKRSAVAAAIDCKYGSECSHFKRRQNGNETKIDGEHLARYCHPVATTRRRLDETTGKIASKVVSTVECKFGPRCSHFYRETDGTANEIDIVHNARFAHPNVPAKASTKKNVVCKFGARCSHFCRETEGTAGEIDVVHNGRFLHELIKL